ncbi:MAG: MarR family transcriptional regulator [Pseudomonadota bacterium]
MAHLMLWGKTVNVTDRKAINPTLFLRPEELRRAADLMFYAHRDFSRLGANILEDADLGAADHRALQIIGRNPAMTVGELITTLKVTKQSLHRTLKQLSQAGLLEQRQGRNDRRQKHLHLTNDGQDLLDEIENCQHERIMQAYRKAGPNAIAAFWEILLYLTDPDEREAIRRSLNLDEILP